MNNFEAFAVGTRELETREILSSSFLESISEASTLEMLRSCSRPADPKDPLARYTFSDIQHYLPDDILTKVDRMSMAHSLEVRSPFLDYRVVELAASFPCNWKIRGEDAKVILQETFATDLPPAILGRRKRGFSMPIASWLRTELKPVLDDALHDAEIESSGIFRMKEVRALAGEHQAGTRDRADFLWRYLFFVRWWHQRGRNGSVRPALSQTTTTESVEHSS